MGLEIYHLCFSKFSGFKGFTNPTHIPGWSSNPALPEGFYKELSFFPCLLFLPAHPGVVCLLEWRSLTGWINKAPQWALTHLHLPGRRWNVFMGANKAIWSLLSLSPGAGAINPPAMAGWIQRGSSPLELWLWEQSSLWFMALVPAEFSLPGADSLCSWGDISDPNTTPKLSALGCFISIFKSAKGLVGGGLLVLRNEGELVLLLFLSLSPCRQKIFQASFPFLPYFCVPKAPVPPVTNFRVIEEGLFSLKVAWTPPLGKLEGYKIYIPRGEFYSLLIHFINLIQFFINFS